MKEMPWTVRLLYEILDGIKGFKSAFTMLGAKMLWRATASSMVLCSPLKLAKSDALRQSILMTYCNTIFFFQKTVGAMALLGFDQLTCVTSCTPLPCDNNRSCQFNCQCNVLSSHRIMNSCISLWLSTIGCLQITWLLMIHNIPLDGRQ